MVQVAVCGMHCEDLNNDTSKILGTHFSNNEKIKEEKNYSKNNGNKYSTSTEYMDNEKSYNVRENCYF